MAKGNGYIRIGANTAALIEDPSQVLEWDDDELRRGCRKSKDGGFPAATTKIIPRAVYDELMRRTIDSCLEEMRYNMPEMIQALMVIVRDPGVDAGNKIKAIGMMMDRVFGKPKERVQVSWESKERPLWEKALDVAIVNEPVDEGEFE
jgi:hypothetical protein